MKAVVIADRDHVVLAEQRRGLEALGDLVGRAHQADVDVAAVERVGQRLEVAIAKAQLDRGLRVLAAAEAGQHEVEVDRAHHAHAHRFLLLARQPLGLLARALRGIEDLPKARQHRAAELGQLHGALRAVEQAPAYRLFEALDRLGQRRLRDECSLRRAGEVQRLGHRQEIADLV